MELLAYIHHAVVYEEACQSLDINPILDAQSCQLAFPKHPISFRWRLWLLVLIASLILQTPAMARTRIVNTNGSGLNVRATPGGAITGVLSNGAAIELTGVQSGEWVQIAGGGYVSAQWLKPIPNSAINKPSTPSTNPPSAANKAKEQKASDREIAAIVSTNGNPLNIRSAPDGKITGNLANNTVVRLTGARSGEWVQLAEGGYVFAGWLRSVDNNGSLSFEPSLPSARDPQLQAIVATNGAGLNVRDRPNGSVIDSLANGTIVTLSGERSGEWVKLDRGGYVSANWLK